MSFANTWHALFAMPFLSGVIFLGMLKCNVHQWSRTKIVTVTILASSLGAVLLIAIHGVFPAF